MSYPGRNSSGPNNVVTFSRLAGMHVKFRNASGGESSVAIGTTDKISDIKKKILSELGQPEDTPINIRPVVPLTPALRDTDWASRLEGAMVQVDLPMRNAQTGAGKSGVWSSTVTTAIVNKNNSATGDPESETMITQNNAVVMPIWNPVNATIEGNTTKDANQDNSLTDAETKREQMRMDHELRMLQMQMQMQGKQE